MAGSISDTQENWFIFSTGFFLGFRAPGIPVDWVVSVLEKIGGS
jgi:hypothetical protein